MEYIVDKFKKPKKLSEEQKDEIAKRIVSDFNTYNDARQSNLTKANELISEVFFKKDLSKENDKNKKWKAKVKMCKLFMFYQTFKAFIWKNTYSGINSMFEIGRASL